MAEKAAEKGESLNCLPAKEYLNQLKTIDKQHLLTSQGYA